MAVDDKKVREVRKLRAGIVKKSVLDFAQGSQHDWLGYIRQVGLAEGGQSLANAIIEEYTKLLAKQMPPEDAALWALDRHGCLELQ